MLYVEGKQIIEDFEYNSERGVYESRTYIHMVIMSNNYNVMLSPADKTVCLYPTNLVSFRFNQDNLLLFKGDTLEEAKEYYEWFINKLLTQKEGAIRLGDYEKEKAAKHPNTGKCSNVVDMRLSPSSPEEITLHNAILKKIMAKPVPRKRHKTK